MDLSRYSNPEFDRGASRLIELAWLLLSALLFESWLPGSRWRASLLRAFGGQVGRGVTIKPHVRIKLPWRLEIGDHVWIGEGVWIDNLSLVSIGSNVCVSQGAYLCTGSHDWSAPAFDLIVKPIVIADQAWVGAMARLAPGTTMGQGSVVGLGAVVSGAIEAWSITYVDPEQSLASRSRRIVTHPGLSPEASAHSLASADRSETQDRRKRI